MTDQTATPALDLSMIRAIADGNKELEHQFITLFIGETRKLVGQLEGLCTSGLNKPWTEVAHKIKGGASNLGAAGLQELCRQAQHTNAEETSAAERQTLYDQIKAEADTIIAYLERVELGTAS